METNRYQDRWKTILQASRSFLNQNFRNQTTGKSKIVAPEIFRTPQKILTTICGRAYRGLRGWNLHSFWWGIRIWGQKFANFRARGEKIVKTNPLNPSNPPDRSLYNVSFLFFCWLIGWLVYLLFPGTREKLQTAFLKGFDLFSRQFSVNFPVEISRKNPRKFLSKSF